MKGGAWNSIYISNSDIVQQSNKYFFKHEDLFTDQYALIKRSILTSRRKMILYECLNQKEIKMAGNNKYRHNT